MDIPTALAELVLLLPAEKAAAKTTNTAPEIAAVARILAGDYASPLQFPLAQAVAADYPARDLRSVLDAMAAILAADPLQGQLAAVALLQLFIQANFTGPPPEVTTLVWFGHADAETVRRDAVRLLTAEGKVAYDLMNDPVLLVLALLVFERLQNVPREASLVERDPAQSLEVAAAHAAQVAAAVQRDRDAVGASLLWWRARALQTHLCVLAEPADVLATVSAALLAPAVAEILAATCTGELSEYVNVVFLLESARGGIHARTEHLAEPFLHAAAEASHLQFVLLGARARRTKFQTFATALLILLAKSKASDLYADDGPDAPAALELDSDLLLEKPQYESLQDLEQPENDGSKKIRLDLSHMVDDRPRLLPIASTEADIPPELRALDPNAQPPLSNLDNVQLLLRLTTLKQTSPAGNAMVDEELNAVVSRIVYAASSSPNWTVFGRALWERSVLETGKSRTVERGILQMTALVEEVGINIRTRVVPQANDSADPHTTAASRLRFIHQLPLMAQWAMDAQLAEKYMSLGVLKSAIDIYLRLHMVTEAALCYAAVDDEPEAERLLVQWIESHPNDARAISILGDIKQDPTLWEKAWAVGRYAKAQASLSHYYYAPPPSSGLTKNLPLAIDHMHECLRASPLSYENWFFYGCCGLETSNFDLAAEAFSRCVALDDTNSHAWSNLASALLRQDKTRQAFTALKRALQQGEGAKRLWRIFENYLLVAAKLGEWNDVLHATRMLIDIRKTEGGEVPVDIVVLEKLSQLLMEEPYDPDTRPSHFQLLCVDLICNVLPSVINHHARCWRLVSRVELWRQRPWAALECYEKAYRATALRPELASSEEAWNEAVEACSDLVSAYESLGELEGKHGAGDVVCKDWAYKSRTAIRSLMSKGRSMWEDLEGWETLVQLKEDAK